MYFYDLKWYGDDGSDRDSIQLMHEKKFSRREFETMIAHAVKSVLERAAKMGEELVAAWVLAGGEEPTLPSSSLESCMLRFPTFKNLFPFVIKELEKEGFGQIEFSATYSVQGETPVYRDTEDYETLERLQSVLDLALKKRIADVSARLKELYSKASKERLARNR